MNDHELKLQYAQYSIRRLSLSMTPPRMAVHRVSSSLKTNMVKLLIIKFLEMAILLSDLLKATTVIFLLMPNKLRTR